MEKQTSFILWFGDIAIEDVPFVGGKNAALGEMVSRASQLGIKVPNGFAITAYAYNYFLEKAELKERIEEILATLNVADVNELQKKGEEVRNLILNAQLPNDLGQAILEAYKNLGNLYGENPDVAVRSSATAEDLPGASFAGQQETYLNIAGGEQLLKAVKKCFASLFTDRAISYRQDKGFSHTAVALSVGVQKMVRSDVAASGVAFSLDTETGFDKVIIINGSYGLGEMIVQGEVTPDEFIVFKPALQKGYQAIIGKQLGNKDRKMIYSGEGTQIIPVQEEERNIFCLTDEEVITLAEWVLNIETYFSQKRATYQPMDIEWAKDGKTGELFIVQARPETIHSSEDKNVYREYALKEKGAVVLKGVAVGTKIASGNVRVIENATHINEFQKGEILVTQITDPDWEPIMKIAAGIITDKGGRTSHAAIVSRELGIPCIVGSERATQKLTNGEEVTIDCSSGEEGVIYAGKLPFDIEEHRLDAIPETKTHIMVNVGTPKEVFKYHYLPAKGVGLGRLEFIINSQIRIHPNALLEFEKNKQDASDEKKQTITKQIEELTRGYSDKTAYYIDTLSEGIAKIASVFYPYNVIIRFSDFKTNEYRTLIGGELYEPQEENPMIGWRGASRYYDPTFKDAFRLECLAIKKVRDEIGLKNVVPMIPFCRTVHEAKNVIDAMKENGLERANDKDLKIYMMCEIPSNVILADEFLELFDGMSIGSNDLTQLTLGLDRDSGIVSHIDNENNEAVKILIAQVIAKCKEKGKYIGICGQAPSDYPDFAAFLVEKGIDSISLNPDTMIKTLLAIAEKEKELGRN